ncbi:MAG: hypothetical protein CL908_25185 [Deltaproteobacteria bacterium]|nr:hypothetical protein [Deltaproteobacteria bacterium]
MVLIVTLLVTGLSSLAADSASAQTEQEVLDQRTFWQDHYRRLLTNRAILKDNAARSRKYYSQAQRRNYPRGGARQQFLLDAENAEKELAVVEQEIAQIFVDARTQEIPPGWLYEVEDEPITIPAAPDADAEAVEEAEDRAGRNPLYFKDDEG